MSDIVKSHKFGPKRGKSYTSKGEGHKGFSMAESHPQRFRKAEGSVKDTEAGANANMMNTASNLPPDFEESARSTAAQE